MDGQAASTWSHGDYIQLGAAIATFLITIAVVIATYRGPLVATQQADQRRKAAEKRSRQMDVFRNLMGYRYDVMSQQFVWGLSMILVEFSHSEPVIATFRAFLAAVEAQPNLPAERVGQLRQEAVIRLLTAMGREMGYQHEQLDIMNAAYAPNRWVTDAEKQMAIRDLMADIATGQRALPVLSVFPEVLLHHEADGKSAIRVRAVAVNRNKLKRRKLRWSV